jgi:hypothetical protein
MGTRPFPFYRTSRYCADYVPLAGGICAPPERLASQINRMVRRRHVEAIVPADLPAALLAGDLAGRLDAPLFPLTDPALLRRLHDKWTFAQFLAGNNLPHPRTALLKRAEDVAGLDFAGPFLVKPREGESGRGIRRVESPAQLESEIRAGGRPLMVQEFIPGSDIDLSFLADRGRLAAWTIQTGEPASLRRVFQSHPTVLEIGKSLAAACGFHGVAHVDLRIDARDGTVRILEINPRFWNTLCHSLCMGVNFPDLGIRMLGGEKMDGSFREPEGICDTLDWTAPRILRAALRARPPAAMGIHAEGMWRLTGADPLPDLCRWARRIIPLAAPNFGRRRPGFCAALAGRYNQPAHEALAAKN